MTSDLPVSRCNPTRCGRQRLAGWVAGLVCSGIAAVASLTLPAQAQLIDATDCLAVGGPIHICDPDHSWVALDLPEDLAGARTEFNDGISAQVEVAANPLVGIQVRAMRPDIRRHPAGTTEHLTKIDGFPAITYVSRTNGSGVDQIEARTELLLFQLVVTAETIQRGDSYSAEHAARHAEMLHSIIHEWSLE